MSTSTSRPAAFGFARPTARFVFGWALASLVANIGIIGTGGAVRLTGSGLGCPTWPECTSGSVVPHQALGIHGVIEFGNRMLTWVLVVVAIATLVAVWRSIRSTRTDRWLAVLLALGIPFQAVIGGITVLVKLNPWIVSLHFLLSMVLVSIATWLVFRTRPNPPLRSPARPALVLGRYLSVVVYLATWVTIYLGTVVTGSGPHAGDANAPRNGLAPDNATQLHADAVFVLIGLAVALAIVAAVLQLTQRRATLHFLGLIALQGVVGVVQYLTDLPLALVIIHMLVSAGLLVGATWLILDFGYTTTGSDDDQEGDRSPIPAVADAL